MQRKIRVLVGKPGLDGHDRGAKVVAAALRDAGMEVIYTGLHQSSAQIVEAALQEDVDVIALSILSGAHMTLFPEVLQLMRERGIADRLLTGGGIIPPEDMETLAGMGVGRLFGPGSSTQDIAEYIRDWCVERHGDVFAPAPPPREVVPEAAAPVAAAVSKAEIRHHAPRAAAASATAKAQAGPGRAATPGRRDGRPSRAQAKRTALRRGPGMRGRAVKATSSRRVGTVQPARPAVRRPTPKRGSVRSARR